jgi:ribosomal protein S18 acetylase RimI-like enzyme
LINIRAANDDDAPAIAEIWFAGWRDGHLGNVPDALVAARPHERFHSVARENIPATTVADVDGEVAGFIVVVEDEVEQVYVGAAHRGTDVAAALLAEAERQVASAGHDVAWLAVVPGNARARRFYERQGWHDDGLFDHHAPSADGPIATPAHRYAKTVGHREP